MKIIVKQVKVYGLQKFYPANEQAAALALIAGTKTLDPKVVRIAAHAFGCEVEVTHEASELAVVA